MEFVYQWPVPPSAQTDGTVTIGASGTPVTAGNTIFLDVIIRYATNTPDIEITDNGTGNVWEFVGDVLAGGARTLTYICREASVTTSISVLATYLSTNLTGSLAIIATEFEPVGGVAEMVTAIITDGGMAAPTAATAGQLVRVVAGAGVSNRTWAVAESGVDLTARTAFAGGQVHLLGAEGPVVTPGDVRGGFTLSSGSSAPIGVVMAIFDTPGDTPTPTNVGQVDAVNVSTNWTPSAGTVLTALSDSDDATYITSMESPSALPLDVTLEPMVAPASGQPARVYLRGVALTAPASTATVTVALYNGSTLRATSSAHTITETEQDLAVTFPSADIGSVDWASVRVVATFTATE